MTICTAFSVTEHWSGASSQWLTIPLVSSLVGYGTNVVALKLTFRPIHFWPRMLAFAQIPNQPFGWLPGWQGIVPAKARSRMPSPHHIFKTHRDTPACSLQRWPRSSPILFLASS